MAEAMDYWDVQAMVDKGDNAERAARQRHIEGVARDLRAEFRREVMDLREEVGELVAEVIELIKDEKMHRERDGRALAAALDARTEHLA
jgi:F0F1-type ATP synthase membrane subunit b/b'